MHGMPDIPCSERWPASPTEMHAGKRGKEACVPDDWLHISDWLLRQKSWYLAVDGGRAEKRGMWHVRISLLLEKTQYTVTPCWVSESAGVYTETKTDSQNNRSHQNTSTHIHSGRLIAPDSGSLSLPSQYVFVKTPPFFCRQTIYLSLMTDLFSVMLGQTRMSLLRVGKAQSTLTGLTKGGAAHHSCQGLGHFPSHCCLLNGQL